MKILMSGSTGLVGSELKIFLISQGHQIIYLVRNKSQTSDSAIYWDYKSGFIESDKLVGIDCVIHLAGENISAKRWTEKQKKKILDSRIQSTNFIIESLIKIEQIPGIFICASAVGYYGNRGEEVLTEQSKKGTGFLSDVCAAWEKVTDKAKEAGMRVVNLRFGMILSEKGGALKKMILPFKLGLGGKIGSGKQYMSWISLQDTIRAIDFCMTNKEINGTVNVATPNPVTNFEFTKTLSRFLKRPAIFPLPAFVAKLFLGEMAEELLLASTRVKPSVLLNKGFEFNHKKLKEFFQ